MSDDGTLVNKQILIAGGDWSGGDFCPPIFVPEFTGPMFVPSDAPLLRYWLSFVVHCRALQVFYGKVDDEKQRQRFREAESCAFLAVQRLFPMSVRHLREKADELVAGVDFTLTAGQEAGLSIHALFTIRQIEVTWRSFKIKNMATVVRCRELVDRAIRCSLPAEYADEILAVCCDPGMGSPAE